jgi:hypothetical protein
MEISFVKGACFLSTYGIMKYVGEPVMMLQDVKPDHKKWNVFFGYYGKLYHRKLTRGP